MADADNTAASNNMMQLFQSIRSTVEGIRSNVQQSINALAPSNGIVTDQLSRTNNLLSGIAQSLYDMSSTTKKQLEFDKSQEKEKEFEKDTKQDKDKASLDTSKDMEGIKSNWEELKDSLDPKNLGIMAILGVISGLLIAPFTFIISALKSFFSSIKALFKISSKQSKIVRFIKSFFSSVIGGITRLFSNIKGFFSSRLTGIISRLKNTKIFKVARSVIKGIIGTFKSIINTIKNIFKPFTSLFKTIGGGGGRIAKMFSKFIKPFKSIIGVSKTLGSLAGKLMLPITFIMGIIDFVKGFSKARGEGKGIMRSIGEGISEIIEGIIGMPLDLLKKAFTWLLDLFGFDNWADTLEDFSFSDLIDDLFNSIFAMISNSISWIGDFFSDAWTKITSFDLMSFIDNIIDSITGAIQSAVNWVSDFFSIDKIVANLQTFNISGMVGDLLGTIPNAIKKAVAWVANLFGFEKISQQLKSFSFSNIISNLIDIPINALKNVIQGVKDFFSGEEKKGPSMIDQIIQKVKDVISKIKKAIMDKIPGSGLVNKLFGNDDKNNENTTSNNTRGRKNNGSDVAANTSNRSAIAAATANKNNNKSGDTVVSSNSSADTVNSYNTVNATSSETESTVDRLAKEDR